MTEEEELLQELEEYMLNELEDITYLDYLKERALEREELMSEDYVF